MSIIADRTAAMSVAASVEPRERRRGLLRYANCSYARRERDDWREEAMHASAMLMSAINHAVDDKSALTRAMHCASAIKSDARY